MVIAMNSFLTLRLLTQKPYGLSSTPWLLAVSLAFALSCQAQITATWTGESGSDVFSDPQSWKDGVMPGPADTAVIAQPGEISIKLSGDASIAKLRLAEAGHNTEPDKVTFQLNGKRLTLLSIPAESDTDAWPIKMNASSQSSRTLAFEGGTLVVQGIWNGTFIGSNPAVLMFDKGTTIDCPGMVYVGADGFGEMYVMGGSKWISKGTNWAGATGHREDASGIVEISGPGSEFSAITEGGTSPVDQRTFYVSQLGSGMLRVVSGAKFACDIVNMGNGIMSEGAVSTIVVDGAGSEFIVSRLRVGGGCNTGEQPAVASGNAVFLVSKGGKARLESLEVFHREGAPPVSPAAGRVVIGGGTLTVASDSNGAVVEVAAGAEIEFRLGPTVKEALFTSTVEMKMAGAKLIVTPEPGFAARVGDTIPLISCPAVNGDFADLPENAVIEAEGWKFTVHYTGLRGSGLSLKVTQAKP